MTIRGGIISKSSDPYSGNDPNNSPFNLRLHSVLKSERKRPFLDLPIYIRTIILKMVLKRPDHNTAYKLLIPGIIGFRQHQGTLNSEAINNWIQLATGLVQACRSDAVRVTGLIAMTPSYYIRGGSPFPILMVHIRQWSWKWCWKDLRRWPHTIQRVEWGGRKRTKANHR